MSRPRRGIGAELLAVSLIAGCVVATLAIVISVHRRQVPRTVKSPAVVVPAPGPAVAFAPKPAPTPPPPSQAPAPVDPTKAIVAELAAAEAEQRDEAEKAAKRIAAIETATKAARAESGRWKRSLALTRAQLDAREAEANRLEGQAEMVAFERDALAQRRDLAKETLQRDLERASYAVLPHRGPHGTWQRPIVVECRGDGVTLRPGGREFNVAELASPFSVGGNKFALTVSREAVRVQRQTAPDGSDVVPYIFFIIRPDGVKSYYEARTRLERIGIAFGYELADADWTVDVPDLDNPATWDGSPPPLNLDAAVATAPSGSRGAGAGPSGGKGDIDNTFVWPKSPPGASEGGGRGGVVAPASPGTGDLPSSRRPAGSGRGAAGFGSTEGGPLTDLDAGAESGRGGRSRGGFGDGSISSGGRSDEPGPGTGRGGEDAWGRLNGTYDPRRPAGLASLDGEGGPGSSDRRGQPLAGMRGIPDPLGMVEGGGSSPARAGADATGRGGLGDIGERGRGPSNRGTAGGGAQGESGEGRAGSAAGGGGQAEGGEGTSDSPGAGTDAQSRTGSLGDRAGGEGTGRSGSSGSGGAGGHGTGAGGSTGQAGSGSPGQAGSGSPGGGGGQGVGIAAGSGIPGSSGEGQAGGSSGGESGESGGGNGIRSPLGNLGTTGRPIELVLACGAKGVAVYPGDYRVTKATLKSKDELLVAQLRAVVRRREQADPGHPLRPSIRYVIEPGGRETYALARAQVALTGVEWPSSTQNSGGDIFRLFSTDDW